MGNIKRKIITQLFNMQNTDYSKPTLHIEISTGSNHAGCVIDATLVETRVL